MKKIKVNISPVDTAIIILMILLCAAMFSSCTTTKYVDREKVVLKTDTLIKTNTRLDSVYVKDSIYVKEYTRNDTVYITRTQLKYRDKLKETHDTIYKSKTDTCYIREKVEEVKKKDSSWKLILGMILMAVILILLIGNDINKIARNR